LDQDIFRPTLKNMKKVLFLDRDGVINRDRPSYITKWEEFQFLPGSIEAVAQLTAIGFSIIIITNQSAIGRKIMSPETLNQISANMQRELEAGGGKILDIFYCPHLPEDGCDCRKPAAGLLRKAAAKYNIDLAKAGLIGDNAKDIICARSTGCAFSVLVESGYQTVAAKNELAAMGIMPDYVGKDLFAAAKWIIREKTNNR